MKRFLFFAIILLSVSCHEKHTDPEKSLTVPEENTPYSSFIDGRTGIIQLEDGPECLIGSADKCVVSDELIYVKDDQRQAIHIFSLDTGKWINTIGRVGRGPQEYIDLADMAVRDSLVYVLSCMGTKVLAYKADGTCVMDCNTDGDSFFRLCFLNEDIWLYSEQSNKLGYDYAQLLTYSGRIGKKIYPFKKFNGSIFDDSYGFIGSESDGIFVSRNYDGVLYKMYENGLQALFRLVFKDYPVVNIDDLSNMTAMKIKDKYSKTPLFLFYSCATKIDERIYLVAKMTDGFGIRTQLLSVDEENNVMAHERGSDPEIGYEELNVGRIVAMKNGHLYVLSNPKIISKMQNKGTINIPLVVNPEGNPVVSIYRLK